MASANTLCKNLLNVKGVVIEHHNFLLTQTVLNIFGLKHVHPSGSKTYALYVAKNAQDMPTLPLPTKSGEDWTGVASSLRLNVSPIVSNAQNMVLLLLVFLGHIQEVASQKNSISQQPGWPLTYREVPFLSICALIGQLSAGAFHEH
jgi:hypothetical protein